jgi:hypothetical protein
LPGATGADNVGCTPERGDRMKSLHLVVIACLIAGCSSSDTGPAGPAAMAIGGHDATPPTRKTPELVWAQYMPHSGAFQVDLPGEVAEQQTEQRTSAGAALVLQYLVDLDGSVFGVMLTSYPPGVLDDMFPQQVMSASRDATMAGMDAEILKEEKNEYVDPDDDSRVFPGRLVLAETPDGLTMKSQWYVVGDTLYQLMQTSSAELSFEGAFERIVKSFQLSSQ